MSSKVELTLKRIRLIQEGKEEEAQKVLEEYWKLCENKVDNQEVINKIIPELESVKIKEQKVKNYKYSSIYDLVNIKGIGKETVRDLQVIYSSVEDLINELNNNKDIPLRNDIEKILRKALL